MPASRAAASASLTDVPHPHPHELQRLLRRRLRGLLLVLLLLLGLALSWQFSSAHEWLEPMRLVAQLRGLSERLGWPAMLGLFVLAGCLAVPLALLALLGVLALGPLPGLALVLSGGMLIALPGFALGRALGRRAVEHLAGPRVQALNHLVARRGLLAVIAIRLVPAAPFTVVNLVLGATRIRWSHFLLGTLVGMTPMAIITATLAPQILDQLQHPSGAGWGTLAAVVLLLGLGIWALKRWARRIAQEGQS